jgi:CheY-like chemotaxis protein
MEMFADVLEQPQTASTKVERGREILLVDDDEVLTDVLSHRLKKQGFKTTTAHTGADGLAKARSQQPIAIVLDLRLPDANGLEICQQLADSAETCTIPVIILSGMETPDILRRCRAAGCRYFLRKPYDPNALLTLIRQSIDESDCWEM